MIAFLLLERCQSVYSRWDDGIEKSTKALIVSFIVLFYSHCFLYLFRWHPNYVSKAPPVKFFCLLHFFLISRGFLIFDFFDIN